MGFYYSGFIYFYGNHHYLWDKKQFSSSAGVPKGCLIVKQWKGYQDNKKLTGSDKTDAIKTANDYFNNDSFFAILHKLRDPGTSRSIVMQDEKEALMVTYTSGGSTWDSYVWI
jgi:hypothetical protein